MTDRAALLVADLARVPAILRAHAAAALPEVGVPSPRRVVLAGLGSSRFAALAVAPALRSVGLDVVVEHASAAAPAPVSTGTLFVAISSSGGTPETVGAAGRAARAGAAVLAVTNRPVSPLAGASGTAIPLEAGEEASGVASASYVATVAVLIRLSQALGAGVDAAAVLAAGAAAAEHVLTGRTDWASAGARLLEGGAPVHVLADAAALGTAEQGALLMRECPRLDADATDAGDWLHVGIYTALPGWRGILLAGTSYDAALLETIHGRGGRVVVVGPPARGGDVGIELPAAALADPLVRALVEPLVMATLAAELWRRARASDR